MNDEGPDELEESNRFLQEELETLQVKFKEMEKDRDEWEEEARDYRSKFHPATIAIFATVLGSALVSLGAYLQHRWPWYEGRLLVSLPGCGIGVIFLLVALGRWLKLSE